MTSRLRPSSAKLLFLSRVRLVVTMKLSNTPSTSVTWRKGRKLRRPIAVDQVVFRASRHVGRIHRYLTDAMFSAYLTSAYSMSPRSRLTSLSRRVGKHGSFRLWGSTTCRCIPPTNWPTESCHWVSAPNPPPGLRRRHPGWCTRDSGVACTYGGVRMVQHKTAAPAPRWYGLASPSPNLIHHFVSHSSESWFPSLDSEASAFRSLSLSLVPWPGSCKAMIKP